MKRRINSQGQLLAADSVNDHPHRYSTHNFYRPPPHILLTKTVLRETLFDCCLYTLISCCCLLLWYRCYVHDVYSNLENMLLYHVILYVELKFGIVVPIVFQYWRFYKSPNCSNIYINQSIGNYSCQSIND